MYKLIHNDHSHLLLSQIQQRVPARDPSAAATLAILERNLALSATPREFVSSTAYLPLYMTAALTTAALAWQLYHNAASLTRRITDS